MASHRVAIIGVGGVARKHALALHELDQAELVAACCRTEDKGREFVDDHGGVWFPDYEQMLDELKPDVAIITTPSGAHLEPVQACAERGVHVLCEKPLEITTARIDRMLAAAKQHAIMLGGVFPRRYEPTVRVVYEAAAGGRFGDLAMVSGHMPWWRDDAYYAPDRWQGTRALDGGGAFMNQAIHTVDAVQWLAGMALGIPHETNPVEEVVAYTAKRGHDPDLIEVEDTGAALLQFQGGALGQLLATTSMYPGSRRRELIGGRGGTAEVIEDRLSVYQFTEERPEDEATRETYGQAGEAEGGAGDPMAIGHLNHMRNIKAFLNDITDGGHTHITAAEARVAVSVIEAIYASTEAGKPVTPR